MSAIGCPTWCEMGASCDGQHSGMGAYTVATAGGAFFIDGQRAIPSVAPHLFREDSTGGPTRIALHVDDHGDCPDFQVDLTLPEALEFASELLQQILDGVRGIQRPTFGDGHILRLQAAAHELAGRLSGKAEA